MGVEFVSDVIAGVRSNRLLNMSGLTPDGMGDHRVVCAEGHQFTGGTVFMFSIAWYYDKGDSIDTRNGHMRCTVAVGALFIGVHVENHER